MKIEKVAHTEPLYYDLVRDLGARKGEKEINIAADFMNFKDYKKNTVLVEYEFAPVNRLGLEAEADVTFNSAFSKEDDVPNEKLESVKLSAQYSFFVSAKYKTTLAIGYTQVAEFAGFNNSRRNNLLSGIACCPFFVAAKRWGSQFNTMVFAYPAVTADFETPDVATNWLINTSFHYLIPQTRHYIGAELNYELRDGICEVTIRPQVKVKLSKKMAVGIVSGLPLNRKNERISSFFRLIYEP